jgi:GntR family transcriptional repressor for pyruvate dehydrogenase complex
LREALKKLETMRVVEIRHGSGVYVSRTAEVMMLASPDFSGTVTKQLLLDLVLARMPIEMQTAALAARNAGEAQLDEMRRLLATAGEHLGDDEVLNAVNMAFHRQIALASGNVVLAQLLDVLGDLFSEEQRLILGIFASREQDHREHLEILDALERRDEPLVVERMRRHLQGVHDVVLRWDSERHPVA